MTHDARHEERLQQMLSGDLASDEAARARLAGCEECAQRWGELSALVATIDSADRERREVLAEAAGLRVAPGSDRVAATLAEERRKSFATRTRSGRRVSPWAVVLAAAALLVAGFFVVRALVPETRRTTDVPLGAKIRFEKEYAILSADVPIRWSYASRRFEVRVRAKDGSAWSAVFEVRQAEWTPTADQLKAMPPKIGLRVVAIDESAAKSERDRSDEIILSVSR